MQLFVEIGIDAETSHDRNCITQCDHVYHMEQRSDTHKVTVVSSGEVTAVTPKGAKPGIWSVFEIEPGSAQSPPHPADRFTYT